MRAANAFRNELEKLIDVVKGLEAGDSSPANNNADAEPTLIHTETLQNENRRYFLDLRENNRGRFLRITQVRGNLFESIQLVFQTRNNFVVNFT